MTSKMEDNFKLVQNVLHFQLAFKFPAKNSEFFRFKYLNFPPKFLDVIVGVVVGGHGDNRGTSFNWHFSVKPIIINDTGDNNNNKAVAMKGLTLGLLHLHFEF